MKASHTPGPWAIKEQTQKLPGGEEVTDYHIFHGYEFICTSWPPESVILSLNADPEYWQAIAKHNAKLIAAAPDLLEALEEALPGIEELNGEFQEGWDSTIKKIEAAISKARGL